MEEHTNIQACIHTILWFGTHTTYWEECTYILHNCCSPVAILFSISWLTCLSWIYKDLDMKKEVIMVVGLVMMILLLPVIVLGSGIDNGGGDASPNPHTQH